MNFKYKFTAIIEQAQIFSGVPSSYYSKEGNAASATQLLNGAAIGSDGDIDNGRLETVYIKQGKSTAKLQLCQGDVVIQAKGGGLRSGIIGEDVSAASVVPSGNLLVIRPNVEVLLGETLYAFLATDFGKAKLASLETPGAVVSSLSVSALKTLEVPVVPMDMQQQISDLSRASQQAHIATLALAAQQRKLADAKITNLLLAEEA